MTWFASSTRTGVLHAALPIRLPKKKLLLSLMDCCVFVVYEDAAVTSSLKKPPITGNPKEATLIGQHG
jgi:hypothetical protein